MMNTVVFRLKEGFMKLILHIFIQVIATLFLSNLAFSQTLSHRDAQNLWSGTIEEKSYADSSHSFHITATTEGNGSPSLVSWTLTSPVDMNKKTLRTWIKIDDVNKWFAIELRMSSTPNFESYISVPMNKFTDPEFNWLQSDSWRRVSFSLGNAEYIGTPDDQKIKYIGLYIQDMGSGALNLSLTDIVVENSIYEANLSITFDDGHYTQKKAADIMHSFGLRGTAYVMPRQIDEEGFLTTKELTIMQNEYGWSLSSHHATPLTQMSPHEIDVEMDYALDFLNSLGSSSQAKHFAYPLGKINDSWALPIIRERFNSARRAGGGGETLPPADWHLLRTVNITSDYSPEKLAQRIATAQAQNEWLILMFHEVVEGEPQTLTEQNIDNFKKLMEVINKSGIKTLLVDEVWQKLGQE